jgi:N-dimethylarginine dimethylaminohydrolase
MDVLVCEPEYFDLKYSINPWMKHLENSVNRNLAYKQWENLVKTLEKMGATPQIMKGHPELPDIVFTANAGFYFKENDVKKIILSNFKHPERQPEKEIYKNWFENNGFECLFFPEGYNFEGAGDVLTKGKSKEIYHGHGFRSDFDVNHWNITSFLIHPLQLVNPHFYHLDTCFCPLNRNYILIWEEAFLESDVNYLMSHDVHLLKIPPQDAYKFACNAVNIDDCVLIPSGCPETGEILKNAGFDVYETDMSEYIKSGGACKCLTLSLS